MRCLPQGGEGWGARRGVALPSPSPLLSGPGVTSLVKGIYREWALNAHKGAGILSSEKGLKRQFSSENLSLFTSQQFFSKDTVPLRFSHEESLVVLEVAASSCLPGVHPHCLVSPQDSQLGGRGGRLGTDPPCREFCPAHLAWQDVCSLSSSWVCAFPT